jgi:hypothetical protein
VRNIVIHPDLPQLLRILVRELPHNIIHFRFIIVLESDDFRKHLVFPGREVDFGRYAAVAPPGATGADDVLTCCCAFFLEQEVQVETVFSGKAFEVAIIELCRLVEWYYYMRGERT